MLQSIVQHRQIARKFYYAPDTAYAMETLLLHLGESRGYGNNSVG